MLSEVAPLAGTKCRLTKLHLIFIKKVAAISLEKAKNKKEVKCYASLILMHQCRYYQFSTYVTFSGKLTFLTLFTHTHLCVLIREFEMIVFRKILSIH